jgi:1,4-dihydroxy-2-naphthoate octaprenyltransferase
VNNVASLSEWLGGLRWRTLPAAIAPVLVGIGASWQEGSAPLWNRAGLAALVALALQIGVNYANDYSDGVRGSDTRRDGPARLTGSGAASAKAVRAAAFAAFGVAAVAGTCLVWTTGQWWLLAVGAAAIAAAWFYTGGRHPYGYMALGEAGVFIFFGPVAVLGTCYTQHLSVDWRAVVASIGVGLLACAILMANNLRDIASDKKADKVTLAVKLGESRARALYSWEMWLALLAAAACAIGRPRILVVLLMAVPTARLTSAVGSGVRGAELVRILTRTGQVELGYAILMGLALAHLGLFNE